jgi:hypothetical protein
VARLSGGGGQVSSLSDMVSLVRSLLPGGPTLLKPGWHPVRVGVAVTKVAQSGDPDWLRRVTLMAPSGRPLTALQRYAVQ